MKRFADAKRVIASATAVEGAIGFAERRQRNVDQLTSVVAELIFQLIEPRNGFGQQGNGRRGGEAAGRWSSVNAPSCRRCCFLIELGQPGRDHRGQIAMPTRARSHSVVHFHQQANQD